MLWAAFSNQGEQDGSDPAATGAAMVWQQLRLVY